jgi:hypothetical protein
MDHNEYLVHEIVDRLFLQTSTFDDFIMSHPVIRDDPKLEEYALRIYMSMRGLYEYVAEKHLGDGHEEQ